MPHFGIFGLEFQKTIVIFEISTLKFVKNESLTDTMNLGIGSTFPKGPGSTFSEGPSRIRVRFIKYAQRINFISHFFHEMLQRLCKLIFGALWA